MHVKNCATMRLSISLCALSRFGVIASISSMKNMHGAAFFGVLLDSRRCNGICLYYLCFFECISQRLLGLTRHT